MHWLILLPYYFIGTLAALPVLVVACRLARVKSSINTLVGTAIGLCLAAIALPLACGWLKLTSFTGRPMLALLLLSFLFAAIDTALADHLPLPLDEELRDL